MGVGEGGNQLLEHSKNLFFLSEFNKTPIICFHRCWKLKKISICTFPKESSLSYISFQNVGIYYRFARGTSTSYKVLHCILSPKGRQNGKCQITQGDTLTPRTNVAF